MQARLRAKTQSFANLSTNGHRDIQLTVTPTANESTSATHNGHVHMTTTKGATQHVVTLEPSEAPMSSGHANGGRATAMHGAAPATAAHNHHASAGSTGGFDDDDAEGSPTSSTAARRDRRKHRASSKTDDMGERLIPNVASDAAGMDLFARPSSAHTPLPLAQGASSLSHASPQRHVAGSGSASDLQGAGPAAVPPLPVSVPSSVGRSGTLEPVGQPMALPGAAWEGHELGVAGGSSGAIQGPRGGVGGFG